MNARKSTSPDNILCNNRNLSQQANYLCLHQGSLRRILMRRQGPPHFKLGGKLYFPNDLTDKWLLSRVKGGQ